MFPTKGLLRHIICPGGAACRQPNCIFSHDFPGSVTEADNPFADASHDQKRRKISQEDRRPPPSEPTAFTGGLAAEKPAVPSQPSRPRDGDATKRLATARRPVSPPPVSKPKALSSSVTAAPAPATAPKSRKKEILAPRPIKLAKMPASWQIRMKSCKMLHDLMVPLNKQVAESADEGIKSLHMDEQALITYANDKEEQLALHSGTMYTHRLRTQTIELKKMTLAEWVSSRREIADKEAGIKKPPAAPAPTTIQETACDLTPEQQISFLSRLVINQDGLDKFGYVTSAPSEEDIAKAKAGVAACHGWEQCDRCDTRFQVFPDRREDGALTTGGACTYHWGKTQWAKRSKTDRMTGRGPDLWACCMMPKGSPGCTTQDTHVFKISEPKTLATVLPFIETPPNPDAKEDLAVTFDCEMGYTVYGLELIRLTAVTWPSGAPLLDVLVRPLGTLLDLNTRFSGVTRDQFLTAKPYTADPDPDPDHDHTAPDAPPDTTLRIVPNPEAARTLLLAHMSPTTPLLGHALENDLNAIRLVHPTLIDTVVLFPASRPLPMRNGLKALTKNLLGKEIQTAGAAGHDSLEDARATGELVALKVAREWEGLKREGWMCRDGVWVDPRGVVVGALTSRYAGKGEGMGTAKAKATAKAKKRTSGERETDDEM